MTTAASPSPDGNGAAAHGSDRPTQPDRPTGVWSYEIPATANPNRLGLQPSSSSTNCSPPPPTSPGNGTHRSSLDGISQPLDGSRRNSAHLGLRHTQSAFPSLGNFPKVSTNFDIPDGPPRLQRPETRQEDKPTKTPSDPIPTGNLRQQQSAVSSRSFADAAARRAAKPPDLFTHNFTAIKPIKLDEGLTILMPESMYEQRLMDFQFALIGRLLLPKGSAPRGVEDLKGELISLFHTSGDWALAPLGKGFFSLKFQIREDQLKAVTRSSWKLASGSMQIREWQPNFDPYKEVSSTVQIWVRLYHLPTEYWHPEFLVGIFRAVGNVIKLDGNTAHGLVGHFARALVEVDLKSPLIDSVRVGLPGNLFYVDFSYENVPLLCTFCHYVGHSVEVCRKAIRAAQVKDHKAKTDHTVADTRPKQKWVETAQNEQTLNPSLNNQQKGVPTSNHFDALQDLEEVVPETSHYDNGQQEDNSHADADQSNNAAAHSDGKDKTMVSICPVEDAEDDDEEGNTADYMDLATVVVDNTMMRTAVMAKSCHHHAAAVRSVQPTDSAAATAEPEAAASAKMPEATASVAAENTPEDTAPAQHNSTQARGTTDPQQHAHNTGHEEAAVALSSSEGTYQPSCSPTKHKGAAVQYPDAADMAEAAVSTHHPSAEQEETAPTEGLTKRLKNKRKAKEIPKTTRQLRSSTKNKSISKVTPEMIEAYARNQCYYVPGDSLGQPKDKQVAPNSPHPKHLEEQLRAAEALGRHTSAYILDTGQRDGLKSMDFIANQRWGDIPHSEVYTDSDINSD